VVQPRCTLTIVPRTPRFTETPIPDNPFDLTGKVAIITGGGTGIGAATARLLASKGAIPVLAGRKTEPLETTAAVIRESTDRPCLTIPTDVRDEVQIENLVAETFAQFGRIDIVINNAGGTYLFPLEDVPVSRWDNSFSLNARAPYLLTQFAGRHMLASDNGGVFVNISSASTHYGVPGGAAYAAAKAALETFTRQTAVEWGDRNIRANAIAVGPVASEGALRSWERAEILEKLLDKAGAPEDIAWTALFLVSPASRFINGETILASGIPLTG
jgi:citronellol/citronellal dehydrogenase